MFRWTIGLAGSLIVVACGGVLDNSENNGKSPSAASGQKGDGTSPASACIGLPTPQLSCVGGRPAPRCNAKGDGTSRWQIDCTPIDPNAPPDPSDSLSVSQCEAAACGAEPAWREDDCMWGFVTTNSSCEKLDRGACTWTRRCKPKPCSSSEGTCNTLDKSKLGESCDGKKPCPTGKSCASFSVNIGESVPPVCAPSNPCEALTCTKGTTCVVMESYPAQVACAK